MTGSDFSTDVAWRGVIAQRIFVDDFTKQVDGIFLNARLDLILGCG